MFLFIVTLLAITSVQINAQYGGYGGYGGKEEILKEEVKEEVKEDKLFEGGIDSGYGKGIITEKQFIGIKPAVYKPPIIPYVKPYIKSYQKFIQPSYGGYGGGIGGGYGGGHGGDKLIPLTKLSEYQPKFDINPFIKPYAGAHLLQKYGKPEIIFKNAPPVFIRQPPIEKTIFQDVFVKQPVIINKQPRIHKEKEVIINKKPAIVDINEKAPVDVKDFGQTSFVKGVGVKETVIKEGGYGGDKLE